MPLVTFSKVSKFFGARDIVEEANWAIEDHRRIGLIGNNGTGKTTLFKMLLGEEAPSAGDISREKGLTVGHLSQHPSFTPGHTLHQEMLTAKPELLKLEEEMKRLEHDMADPAIAADAARMEKVMERYSVAQDHFAALDGYAYESKAEGVLEAMKFSKAEFDRDVASFSGGEKTRLMLAKLLISQPKLLLLDEPTNHLDTQMCEWLEAFLKDYDGSLVVISHDRYFLDNVVDEIVELKDCRLKYYPGNYSYYKENKDKQQELAAKAKEEQNALIARTQDFIARNIAGQNTKQAQARRRMLEKLEIVEGPERKARGIVFQINQKQASGKEVATFHGVGKSFGERTLLKPFENTLYRGRRVGLIGPNGAGKTTLLKVLVGKEPASVGKTSLGSGVDLGYYDQFQSDLSPKNSVMEEIWSLLPGEGQQSIRGIGGRFLFSGDDIDKKISSLSGGEKARLLLAKLMIKGPNFLVMDEPTNHLDILSREVVEEALDDYEGTLLVVSHDRYFLDRECDQIWDLQDEEIVVYEGNYSEYREQKKKQERELAAGVKAAPKVEKPPSAGSGQAQPSQSQIERDQAKEAQAKARELAKRQQDLEKRIAELEKKKKELEDGFLDPELTKRPDKMRAMSEDLGKVKDELEASFDKWQELEERKG
jgi:ATP-binding cassette subfamily F protein 3